MFWKVVTSLRITVICLAFAIVLVFVGTVAQADEGLYQAQTRYFSRWIVIGATMWGHHVPLVLPGGYAIGTALLINLAATFVRRFRLAWSKLGIHLTHTGIIILLVGQLATQLLQVESRMSFSEGQTANYVERHRGYELAFMSDAGSGQDDVVSIPRELVAKGAEIAHPKLPFTVRVQDYAPNGDVVSQTEISDAAGKLGTALATVEGQFSTVDGLVPQAQRAEESEGRTSVWRAALQAVGEKDVDDIVAAAKRIAADPKREGKLRTELKTRFRAEMLQRFTMQGGAMRAAAEQLGAAGQANPLPPAATNGAGARSSVTRLAESKDMDSRDLPFAVLEIVSAGKSLGTWLVSPLLRAQEITADGKTVRVAFRDERHYLPFSLKLVQATHKKYAGSDTPKDFRSRVLIDNPATKENREVEISMNNPLRYGGLAFFQYQMTKDELDARPGSSVLQVVRNPSWLAPYIGCIVVATGMLWQFLHHLVGFITRRRPA
ncbi:MAG TPA: cytochrome c biogenesis protein ResB [Chthoniobacteraceae bacterium]|nr:cytochrome c biogenesis protein ResB [Chthoniobacteraceae bacterium]